MNPNVTNISEEDNVLRFQLSGVNMSLANALRRIMLSEIETVVFRTAPYKENLATIDVNTSRLNNEIIKQRLSCVPIHLKDLSFPINDYQMEVEVTNDTDSNIYVTTEDFKVKHIHNDIYLPKEETKKWFPPNDITNMYIDLVRLRPRLADNIPGESLKMSCLFDIGTAKQDGMFNVVSTCSYGFTVDKIAQADAWSEKEKEYKDKKMTKDDIASLKQNWLLLEGKRHTISNSFEFVVESVGVFENMDIVDKACAVMLNKLKKFITTVQNTLSDMVVESESTIPYCYDIKLVGEDYTLGKVLEYILYTNYYVNNKSLAYCGFQKPHPHIDVSLLRLAFKEPTDNEEISKYLIYSCTEAMQVFEKIKVFFETNDNGSNN